MMEEISTEFITYAASILSPRFKGEEIIQVCAKFAIEADIQIPYPAYPCSLNTKATVLSRNLSAFPSKWRYKIIQELCNDPKKKLSNNDEINNLQIQLISKYGDLDDNTFPTEINYPLIQETFHWLDDFPDSFILYKEALQKLKNNAYLRNALDDLRLALESLLREILENNKTLENQQKPLGNFIDTRKGSKELKNMFMTLLRFYADHQNNQIKHHNDVIETEVYFVVEITTCFMRHLIRTLDHPKC